MDVYRCKGVLNILDSDELHTLQVIITSHVSVIWRLLLITIVIILICIVMSQSLRICAAECCAGCERNI